MAYDKCVNCVGAVELSCEAARSAAQMGFDKVANFDPDLRDSSMIGIAQNIGSRVVQLGCAFSVEHIRAQIIEQAELA